MTSIVEVYQRWPTKEDCIAHLEAVRWGGHPLCPYCGADRVSRHRELTRDDRWQCQRCDKSFSVTVGTIFHKSHMDLQLWFLLIALMMAAKKGLSSMQAARDLGIRQPTAWSMMMRIRKAMVDDGKLLGGIVEMDETYVGGKPRRKNRRSDDPPGGQGVTTKEPVVGAIERGGRVKARTVERSELTGDDMAAFFCATVEPRGTMLTTDASPLYRGFNRFVAHRSINHTEAYSERDMFSPLYGATHTNTIDGFWATVKRAIYGQAPNRIVPTKSHNQFAFATRGEVARSVALRGVEARSGAER